jgi:tetraacyldisaccharide 4'-kinase
MKMRLQRQIESIMNDRAEPDRSLLHCALMVASLFYGGGVRLRELAYTKDFLKPNRLPCPVISIGNITLGGTGKTPMTIYVSELLLSYGLTVAVISRGYGGKAEKKGGVVCDGRCILMRPEVSGDEPIMIAKRLQTVPVLVGGDRFKSGETAIRRFKPDVLLLDDAFQHRQLARDMDIVLMDAEMPLGNGYLFPRGVLREDGVSLKRCHAVVFTRAEKAIAIPEKNLGNLLNGKPVFQASHEPYLSHVVKSRECEAIDNAVKQADPGWLSGKRVYAFSGIARNDDFRNEMVGFGCTLVGFSSFPDHYRYGKRDIAKIADAAVHLRADCLATTEKDYFRMSGELNFPMDLAVIGVGIRFMDDGFDLFIKTRLAQLLKKTIGDKGIVE